MIYGSVGYQNWTSMGALSVGPQRLQYLGGVSGLSVHVGKRCSCPFTNETQEETGSTPLSMQHLQRFSQNCLNPSFLVSLPPLESAHLICSVPFMPLYGPLTHERPVRAYT